MGKLGNQVCSQKFDQSKADLKFYHVKILQYLLGLICAYLRMLLLVVCPPILHSHMCVPKKCILWQSLDVKLLRACLLRACLPCSGVQ